MCGIAGAIGLPAETAMSLVKKMHAALRHRGPDDSGIQCVQGGDEAAVFSHNRLSVLDLSPLGHQPMCDATEGRENWVTFNGELYNYQRVRRELEQAGLSFRSGSDTEVLLKAYRRWGESAVERLEGMFAWALWDGDKREAVLCRDRLGIKPLYYFRSPKGGFFFASEVRALLELGSVWLPRELDPVALEAYLAQGAVWGEQTLIKGVSALEPGSLLHVAGDGSIQTQRLYWDLYQQNATLECSREQAVEHLRECLDRAVSDHLISDVPVGIFLSGGIDSSALAILAGAQGKSLQAITLGFSEKRLDEAELARGLAKSLRLSHEVVRYRESEILELYPAMLASMDQPSMDGFNTYLVSKAVRDRGLKVVLSGLGGDELFGGYPSFTQVPSALQWKRYSGWLSGTGIGGMMGRLRSSFFRKTSAVLERPGEMADLFLLRRELFLPRERRAMMPRPEESEAFSGIPLLSLQALRDRVRRSDPQNQISLLEMSTYMRSVLLRDSDVFSMAHGLELRLPFLDTKLVELTRSLRGSWKRPSSYTKPLLVDAVANLPEPVYRKKKQGFVLPWQRWIRGPLKDLFFETLSHGEVWRDMGINPTFPASLSASKLHPGSPREASQLIALFNLGYFVKKHGLTLGS